MRRGKRLQVSLVLLWFVALSAWPAVPAQAGQSWTGRVTEVSQGDRLTVERQGQAVRLRLFALECPEMDQPFGEEARKFTASLCLNKEVLVKGLRVDDLGLMVARVVLADQRELNSELLRAGLAWWVRQEAPGEIDYDRLQFSAQFRKNGLWIDPEPIRPWEWRQGKRPKPALPGRQETRQEAAPEQPSAEPESRPGQAEPGAVAKKTAEKEAPALKRPRLKWLSSPAAEIPAGQAWAAWVELLDRPEPPVEVSLRMDWGDGQVESFQPEAGRFELSHVFFKGGRFSLRAVAVARLDKEKESSEPLEAVLSVTLKPPSLALSVSGEDNRKTFQVKAASGSFPLADWELDFGDGKEPALGQGEVDLRLVHVYPSRPDQRGAGDMTYTAVLRASDAKGNRFSRRVEAVVRVREAGKAPGEATQTPTPQAGKKEEAAGQEKLPDDLRLGRVNGPSEVEVGQEASYEVNVENSSGRPADGCQVALLVSGQKRASRTLNLGPGASLREVLTFSPSSPGQADLRIVLIPPSGFNDADLANNVHDTSLRVRPKPGTLTQKTRPAVPLSGDLSLSEVRLLSQPILTGRAATLAALVKNQSSHQIEGLKVVLAVDGRREAEEVFDLSPEHASVVLLDFTPNQPGRRTIRLTVSGPAGFKDAEPANNVFEGRVEVLSPVVEKGEHPAERAASTKKKVEPSEVEVVYADKKVEPPLPKVEPTKEKIEPPKAKAESPKDEVASPEKKVEPPLAKVESPKAKAEPSKAKVEPPEVEVVYADKKVEPPLPKVEPTKEKIEPPKAKAESPKDEVASPEKKVEPPLAKVESPKAKAEPSKTKVEPSEVEVVYADKKVEPPLAKEQPTKEKAEPLKVKAEPAKVEVAAPEKNIEPALTKEEPPKEKVEPPKAKLEPPKGKVASTEKKVEAPRAKAEPLKEQAESPKKTVEPPQKKVALPPEKVEPQKERAELQKGRIEPTKGEVASAEKQIEPPLAKVEPPKEKVEPPKVDVVSAEKKIEPPQEKAVLPPEKVEPPPPAEEPKLALTLGPVNLPRKAVPAGQEIQLLVPIRNAGQEAAPDQTLIFSVDGRIQDKKEIEIGPDQTLEIRFDYTPDQAGRRKIRIELFPSKGRRVAEPERTIFRGQIQVLAPVVASKPPSVEKQKSVEVLRADQIPPEDLQSPERGNNVAEQAPEVKERPEPQAGEGPSGDLVLSRTKLPSKSVGPGTKVKIVALVRNQSPVPVTGGVVVLNVDGQPVDRKPLELQANGSAEIVFDYVPDRPGQRAISLELIPPEGYADSRPQNNRIEAGLSVVEAPAPAAAKTAHPPAGPPAEGRFTIQVAAYANQALARDLAKKLDERYGPGSGAVTEYFDGRRNLYRVRAFLVSSLQAAKEKLRQLNADGFGNGFVVPLD